MCANFFLVSSQFVDFARVGLRIDDGPCCLVGVYRWGEDGLAGFYDEKQHSEVFSADSYNCDHKNSRPRSKIIE